MTLNNLQRIHQYLKEENELNAIRIKVPERRIRDYFSGSGGKFFRLLKNGLYSFNKITNREFFAGFSGVYFTYSDSDIFEMIILYEKTSGIFDQEELIQRIKKLIGIDAEIELGFSSDFKSRIEEIKKIKSQTQLFGSAYFS